MIKGRKKNKVFHKKFKPTKRVPLHVKLHSLLQQNKQPVVTFYFEPRTVVLNAKGDNNVRVKKLGKASQVMTLSDRFLKDNNGRRRSTKHIARDIHDICHDIGASVFVV